MTGGSAAGGQPTLRVIGSDIDPDVDPMVRLNEFRDEQPEVNVIISLFRYVAEIPAGSEVGDMVMVPDPSGG